MKKYGFKDKYTGIEIINKLLKFMSLTPNPDDWFLDTLESNPPRYMLLQQILALMAAFEIEQSNEDSIIDNRLQKFFNNSSFGEDKQETAIGEQRRLLQFIAGDFARKRKPDDSPAFMAILKKYVDENDIQYNFCMRIANRIPPLFSELLYYKRLVYKLLDFNGGCIAAAGLYAFAIRLTDAQARSIDTRDLDAVLESIVNPKALSFTEAELIAKYQFPSEEKYLNVCGDWI